MRESEFSASMAETEKRYGRCYDYRGLRVVAITQTHCYAGRFSSLGGWADGESYNAEPVFFAEDGRALSVGEWVVTSKNDQRRFDGGSLLLAGVMGVPSTPASSDWYPFGAVCPEADSIYANDYACQSAWEAAWESARAEKAAKKAEKANLAEKATQMANSPFAKLASMAFGE